MITSEYNHEVDPPLGENATCVPVEDDASFCHERFEFVDDLRHVIVKVVKVII